MDLLLEVMKFLESVKDPVVMVFLVAVAALAVGWHGNLCRDPHCQSAWRWRMSRAAWAKCPSFWAKVKVLPDSDSGALGGAEAGAASSKVGVGLGLGYLSWRQHKGGATASFMVLFALCILSNQAQRKKGLRTDNQVTATYDQLMEVTELSRALISKGLTLLKELGVIKSVRIGNGCAYELVGIESDGRWCALPQGHLLDGADYLKRLKGMREFLKRASSLHAMKLYMLLLTFRDRYTNMARISYDHIGEYTGMRREEISVAVQLLVGAQLCRLATNEEGPLKKGEHAHNRYMLTGLAVS